MDQFLNMEAIVKFGAGLMMRADRITPITLKENIKKLLNDPQYSERASNLACSSISEGKPFAHLAKLIVLLAKK
jgi:UDP:flavonoid glycosyltransferase YjiC (YdhE family)